MRIILWVKNIQLLSFDLVGFSAVKMWTTAELSICNSMKFKYFNAPTFIHAGALAVN